MSATETSVTERILSILKVDERPLSEAEVIRSLQAVRAMALSTKISEEDRKLIDHKMAQLVISLGAISWVVNDALADAYKSMPMERNLRIPNPDAELPPPLQYSGPPLTKAVIRQMIAGHHLRKMGRQLEEEAE